jgi:ferric-dicitrate binding protein FerR (iron transport regulator)
MTREESEQQALYEAAGWMARLAEGPPPATVLAGFRAWLEADPLHVTAMDRVERQWRLSKHMAPADAPRRRRPSILRLRAGIGLAALTAAVMAIFLLVRPLYGEAQFATGVGEVRDVTLADGSRIHLDADSAIDVRYKPLSRIVQLSRGAGDFTVAHNGWRPFTVEAGPAMIRVTGTHFLVRQQSGEVSAYLISGGIELSDSRTGEHKAVLRPGNRATVSASGAVLVQASDGSKDKAWLSGKLLFDQTSLSDALDQFRPYGPVPVRLASDDLRALRISGLYGSADLRGFLQSVATAYPVRLTATGDGGVVVEKLPGKK